MRHRVLRLLYITLLGPITALVVAAPAAATSALAAAPPAAPPAPYVVCVDPGHGGSPNNSDPGQLFDPGAIGVNGLLEKNVTLAVSLQLEKLLQAQDVSVAMTRTTDVYLSIPAREQTCIDAGAQLFVSVHFNSFTSPSAVGSLVLYPSNASLPFAEVMSHALGTGLASAGIPDDGVTLRSDWWIHAPMPTVTVEAAYLSNPTEAAQLATTSFRDQVAQAIDTGLVDYAPAILQHKAAVQAWNATHRNRAIQVTPVPAEHHAVAGASPAIAARHRGGMPPLWLVLAALVIVGLRLRRLLRRHRRPPPRPPRRRREVELVGRRAPARPRTPRRATGAGSGRRGSIYDNVW